MPGRKANAGSDKSPKPMDHAEKKTGLRLDILVNFKLFVPRISLEPLDQICNFGWRPFYDLQEMTVVVHQKTSDVINVVEASRFVQ
jgi:hypothetical protein